MIRWSEVQFQVFLKKHKKLSLKTKAKDANRLVITDGYTSNFRGWVTVGGKKCHFKSLSELNYAYYLQWQKTTKQIYDWEYEPQCFVFPTNKYKRGPFYYKPDFRVRETKKRYRWHEVKGHMNPASRKKIKRFNKHYAETEGELIVIGADWFKSVGSKLSSLIPGWQSLAQLKRRQGL